MLDAEAVCEHEKSQCLSIGRHCIDRICEASSLEIFRKAGSNVAIELKVFSYLFSSHFPISS